MQVGGAPRVPTPPPPPARGGGGGWGVAGVEVQAELPQRKEGNRPEEHRAQRNCGERRSSGQGG